MAQLSDHEAAEDYRRQRQEAAARLAGLESFEARDPVLWFDAHKEILTQEALEAGSTPKEIENTLAEMRAKIATTPAGTRFDDPFGRIILGRLVERVQGFCNSQNISMKGGVAYGLTPVTTLSDSLCAVMGTDAGHCRAIRSTDAIL